MHNLKGRQSAVLDVFSGLVTLANPEDLPEGASPRNQNMDFKVGTTFTRDGLVNEFTYENGSAGPSPGGTAVDTSIGGAVWANPTGVLAPDSAYATCILPGEGFVAASNTGITQNSPGGGVSWNPLSALISASYSLQETFPGFTPATASITVKTLAIPSGAPISGIEVSFKAFVGSGSSALNFSFGGATRSQPLTNGISQTFQLGSSTDMWGTMLTAADFASGVILTVAPSSGSAFVYAQAVSVTVHYAQDSDALDIEHLGFSVASSQTVAGFVATIQGYASAAATISAQLIKAGTPVGTPMSVPLNVGSQTTLTIGSINDLFGTTWIYSDLNATNFGVRLIASSSEPANVFLGYVTLTAYFLPTQENYNYISTFEDSFGNIYNIALDALGNFWIENVSANPGVLSPLFTGPPAGSFASSFTADSRQYIAISDLLQGNYPPQQYTGQWNDRVSQVGPGGPPSFTGTLQSGTPATITAYSVTSNVVTLTATNTLTAGEVVTFSISAGPTFLNGQSLSVLGTGLSGSQFEVAFITPNASGSATGTAVPQYQYPIVAAPNGITQYAQYNGGSDPGQFDEVILSAGPGTLQSGNVVTCYYSPTAAYALLVNAFQSGKFPVYVYISGAPVGNGTQLVTSVGLGKPPGLAHERFYFTFNIASAGANNYGNPSPGVFQMTVATLTTVLPLPGVETGDQVTITGDPDTSWNQTWNIVQALNSGTYAISETAMTAGVATYNWQLSGATSTPPVAGQLVTVTNTLNGDGIFNVTDAAIQSVTGTSSGTFTVAGFAGGLNFSSQAETGQATTSGTLFQIDPGPLSLGNSSNPIFGNSGGGYITLVGSTSVIIQPGTRRGVCFFITRNSYYTAPSPYVQFSTVENTNYILAANIPVGPPNVIARAIAFTEAGENDVPGASYYTIPTPVEFVLNGVTYTSSSLFINDNTTTTAKFTFTDSVLLNAEEIDIQGADLFNQGELGDAAWCMQYAGRTVWGRVRNQIQNFVNLSFDGGYNPNPGSNLLPLGWNLDPSFTTPSGVNLLVSPVFGNSFYIQNETGSTQAVYGLISQPAYQDQNLVPILNINTAYSLRVTVRTPSGATQGALMIDLTEFNSSSGYGRTYGQFVLNLSAMTSNMATYSGTLLTEEFTTVPAGLLLRVYVSNLANGGDVEIDRINIFPTLQPTNLTQLTLSYKDNPEAFDLDTGNIDTSTVNAQPANGSAIIHDQAYIFKESSMGYIADSPNQEPAQWNPYREVSNVAGACGINAYDIGEEWAIVGCRNGLYGFNGGAPMPMMLEIVDLWNAINWDYGYTMCIRNDTENRRILIAVPLPTPNIWLPYAAANANPTTPNVVLCMNYQGIGSIEELMSGMSMHVTMMGKLAVQDLRRKWSIWTIPTPYMGVCKRSELDEEMLICNGIQSSKIYALDPESAYDDGANIPWMYTTYGFVDQNKATENPMFGMHNKRFAYLDLLISGMGTAQCRLLQNVLSAPYPWVIPGGVALTDPAFNDLEFPLDEFGMRMFIEVSANVVPGLPESPGCYASLSRATLVGKADNWSPIRGV